MNNAYFSVLEAQNYPQKWLFISFDIVTSILIFVISLILLEERENYKKIPYTLIVFALSILLDAVIPISNQCIASISQCGIALGQVLSFHDIMSIVAYLSIAYCLISLKRKVRKDQISSTTFAWIKYTLYSYSLTGLFLVLTIVIDKFTTLSQALFLLSIGLSLAIIPLVAIKNKQ